ncbi:putative defense protein 1 [Dreissena polymorpha]|nr:putative defense protein 1 [Dreissena polymorpha]
MDIMARVVALMVLTSPVSGYSGGAPASACATMIPGHGGTAHTSVAPFSLTVSSVISGCVINSIAVTLAGTGGTNFRGFLCQARSAMDSDTTVGTLADDDTTVAFTNNCGAGSITHSEGSDKGSANFKWTPSRETSNVHIVCTVIQTTSIYWVKAVHAQVSPCSSAARATLTFMASVGVLLAYVL